jgi:hypothetical protein
MSGTVCCKSVQILPYSDSIVITGRMPPTAKETSELLVKAAKKMGLLMKIKYMVAGH